MSIAPAIHMFGDSHWLILRSIPSSIRPIPSSIHLTVDEYDNEWNDQKYEFLQLSLALLDLTVEKNDNDWMNEWMNELIW